MRSRAAAMEDCPYHPGPKTAEMYDHVCAAVPGPFLYRVVYLRHIVGVITLHVAPSIHPLVLHICVGDERDGPLGLPSSPRAGGLPSTVAMPMTGVSMAPPNAKKGGQLRGLRRPGGAKRVGPCGSAPGREGPFSCELLPPIPRPPQTKENRE